ncbi:MAG: biotin--[acetyl-CoA-carboxylase] ligase [Lachnospiraceae bacterium]|nr:biotin--[acetyl-CoA-carboxylase] ligase [Lachnospiraceae bacterium]
MIRQQAMEDALRRAFASRGQCPLQVEVFEEVGSTNSLLKEEAADGAAEGRLLVANAQTAGRGRLTRSFFSPSGTGVYSSLLLRPVTGPETTLLLTAAAAVAVIEAVRLVYGIETGIKWVNDIYYNERKICGILAEGSFVPNGESFDYVVIGIGINLRTPHRGFPEELREIAGSLLGVGKEAPSEDEQERDHRFVAALWACFWQYYQELETRDYVSVYRARSILTGRAVRVTAGTKERRAVVLEIDEDCRLLVRLEDGSVEALSYGEVLF